MDYFTDATTNKVLDCSKADYKNLQKLINEMDKDEDFGPCGLFLEYAEPKDNKPGLLYIYGKEYFNSDGMSDKFIKAVGKLLKKNKLKTLLMGVSFTATKHAPESHGGQLLVFYDSGLVEYQTCLINGNYMVRTAVRAINRLINKTDTANLSSGEKEALENLANKLKWQGPELPEDNSYDV